MGALFQLKIGRNGELALLIHKDLWEELTKPEAAVSDGSEFMCIQLAGMSGERLLALAGLPRIDEIPCRPLIQFNLP